MYANELSPLPDRNGPTALARGRLAETVPGEDSLLFYEIWMIASPEIVVFGLIGKHFGLTAKLVKVSIECEQFRMKECLMLVLSRKSDECIQIGDAIMIRVLRSCHGRVRIGIDAPCNVPVRRVGRRSSAADVIDEATFNLAAVTSWESEGGFHCLLLHTFQS